MIPYSSYKNSWAAVVTSVSQNVLDLAVSGISLTLSRTKVVDFTTRIRVEPYSIIYALYDDPLLSWRNILLPFQLTIWMTVIVSIFSISVLLVLAVRFTRLQGMNITLSYFVTVS